MLPFIFIYWITSVDIVDFFRKAISFAHSNNFRYPLVIRDDAVWKNNVLLSALSVVEGRSVQLGGKPVTGYEYYKAGQGNLLLGQECRLLYIDLSEDYNANSINAALGTVIGGGIVLFSCPQNIPDNFANQWLIQALSEIDSIDETSSLPSLYLSQAMPVIEDIFSEQKLVVEEVVAVKRRRANRPLVITADRGRGKTTALGLAAARLLSESTCSLVVTAPRWESVKGLFSAVISSLGIQNHFHSYTIQYNDSLLRFVAPDALESCLGDTDILFVDEASSLPLATLFSLCDSFPRVVFSTTVHGYEGCGRGFSLKFIAWLNAHYPLYRQLTMIQPMRWAQNDPVEEWANNTFLLSPPLREDFHCSAVDVISDSQLLLHTPEQLINDKQLLSEIFHILVDAHYQTSPNDLMHLLSDPLVSILSLVYENRVLGCVTVVAEPPLPNELIQDVSLGKRRPKGYLTPISFLNQIGVKAGASVSWYRIMRIALLPELQKQGIGSYLLSSVSSVLGSQYISTSFGATAELTRFWMRNNFVPVKIGSHKDQASGCYSLLMIYQSCSVNEWANLAYNYFKFSFPRLLNRELKQLDLVTSCQLLLIGPCDIQIQIPYELIKNYALGGSNYESVSVWLEEFYFSLESAQRNILGNVFLLKVLKNCSWSECSVLLNLSGKKEVEALLREKLKSIYDDDIYTVN